MSSFTLWLFLALKSTAFWMVKLEIACSEDYFEHSCPEGELLAIHSAEYGFLHNGSCNIWFDELNHNGCRNDMTHDVSRTCTGKNHCRYPPSEHIPSGFMHKHNENCVGSTLLRAMYAEITYGCYPMIYPDTDCVMSGSDVSVRVIPASLLQRKNCILKIIVRKGQRIQMKITDNTRNEGIREYGIILEPESNTSQVLVKGIEYHSISSQYWINITKYNKSDVFILNYKVLGCPSEITLPQKAVVRYQNSTSALIGCNTSSRDVTWELRCFDNMWQGMEKNCTWNQTNSRWGVIVAMASGSVLILLASVSVVAVCYCCRSRKSQQIVEAENRLTQSYLPTSAQNSCRSEMQSSQCDNYCMAQLNSISSVADNDLVYPPPPRQSYLAQLEASYARQDKYCDSELEDSLTPPPTPPPQQAPSLSLPLPRPPTVQPPQPPTSATPEEALCPGQAQYSLQTALPMCGQVINGMSQFEEPSYYSID